MYVVLMNLERFDRLSIWKKNFLKKIFTNDFLK